VRAAPGRRWQRCSPQDCGHPSLHRRAQEAALQAELIACDGWVLQRSCGVHFNPCLPAQAGACRLMHGSGCATGFRRICAESMTNMPGNGCERANEVFTRCPQERPGADAHRARGRAAPRGRRARRRGQRARRRAQAPHGGGAPGLAATWQALQGTPRLASSLARGRAAGSWRAQCQP